MIPIRQENSLNLLEKAANGYNSLKEGVSNGWNSAVELKDGVAESLETIADLAKIVIKAVDWFATIIMNPIIIVTAIDKLSVIVIMTLIILKILGFDNLDKWIWLTFLIKVITMALI